MKKIVTIVGARPQFVKAAVVSKAWRNYGGCAEVIIHTGQHYDTQMSDIFFQELEIPHPRYHLGVGSGRHGAQTGQMLAAIEECLIEEKPDCVLVYGDTNSTLAGALAASKLHIPVAHVEAGLRSYNRRMPEEINRVLTDHVSDFLLVPTENAAKNLRKEGLEESKISLIGDVMYDVAMQAASLAAEHSSILDKNRLQQNSYVLATVHRAENTDSLTRLHAIIQVLGKLNNDLPVVLPVHPRTRKCMVELSSAQETPLNLPLILDPVGYLDMLWLTKNARIVVTDSGGLQKEAYFHGVPCLTLRDETEWIELVESGWNRLISPESLDFADQFRDCIDEIICRGKPPCWLPFYGDGHAAEKVCEILA